MRYIFCLLHHAATYVCLTRNLLFQIFVPAHRTNNANTLLW